MNRTICLATILFLLFAELHAATIQGAQAGVARAQPCTTTTTTTVTLPGGGTITTTTTTTGPCGGASAARSAINT